MGETARGAAGIAIVGMACRYADARSPGELWENVLARRRAFRRIPAERLRLADYLTRGTPGADPDSLYATEAAVLEGWEFDRVRFRVAGSTFRTADLTHWLALDVAAQVLADAGFPDAEGLSRDTTGVLLGNTLTGEFSRANLMRLRWPYVRRVLAASLPAEGWEPERIAEFLDRLEADYKAPFPEPTEESLAGGLANTIAGRICNHFDLHGGGYTLDGACSSSLLAIANACSALAAGDLDVALAGGVDLSLDPFELVGFARTGALAPEEMRVYDLRSAGFIPGEGCGFVVLMRETEALRAGCRIHAVIRGWGISSDGRGGISRPEPEGQLLALRRAYRRAGFGIDTVGYFEGHGTGTAVGDAAELAALSQARRETGVAAPAAPIGSIKANLGHTKAAAGVAGLIKATLAVGAQLLPPNTGCDEPHPELAAPGAPLRILERAEPWPAGRPVRAGVSAMGFGGINAHLVIEGEPAPRRRELSPVEIGLLASPQDAEILLLSAADPAALAHQIGQLRGVAERLSRAELGDLAAELHRRLAPLGVGPARAAVVAGSPRELGQRLELLQRRLQSGERLCLEPRHGLFLGIGAQPRRIGFLFPGQGSPAHLQRGAWRHRFPESAGLYDLAGLPAAKAGAEESADTAVAQPAILAHALAGLELLDRLGIRAGVGVGHSLGEIAALHWGGALDSEAAIRLAVARGRAMAELPGPTGTMASLAAPAGAVEALLAPGVTIAAYNGPRRTVVSGELAAVEALCRRAEELGIASTRLRVSHAFHSPLVAASAAQLAAVLAETGLRPPGRKIASTVSGGLLDGGEDLRALLIRQITSPVLLTEALAAVREQADLWIEVGPGQAMSEIAAESLAAPVLSLDVGGPSLAGLLKVAGATWAAGVPIDAAALFAGRFHRPFDPERAPVFLANPCESAPASPEEPATLRPRPQPVREEPALPKDLAPLDVVRHLVAERAELPVESVAETSRLLGDLHLNSISVGQMVVEAARRLGLRPPASPTDYAQATVAQVAQALADLGQLAPAAGEPGSVPPGVDSWVRPFTVELVPGDLPRRPRSTVEGPGSWTFFASDPWPALLAGRLRGSGVALCLPPEPDEEQAGLFLAAAEAVLAAPEPRRFLVLQQGGGGGGFARTLHLERPEVAVWVIDLPYGHPEAAGWIAAEVAAGTAGYTEAHYDTDGRRRVPVLRPLPLPLPPTGPASPPLGPEDVVLVSGGGKGITAECALTLALGCGARLGLLGRSRPEDDPELAANLHRFAAAGARLAYVAADVTDQAEVAAAVARIEAELGPVTALLHGAGSNRPRLLGALTEEDFRRTLAPKVRGFANLLAAVDPARLRLAVSFGSIIARIGLQGEADYATANEWLARATAELGRDLPHCRCLTLEWSVWSGVGMGERLGTLESLLHQGITPIPPDVGLALLGPLLALADGGSAPASVVVAGRFGEPPTLTVERPELPLLRFLEKPRVYYPGIELVADAEISADTDPYLADHVFRGEPLFAAVLGLEAMAQVAMALVGTIELPVFEDVQLTRPVAVPAGRSTTLRIAALVREPGTVEVVCRDGATGFAADHFRAICRFGPRPAEAGARLLRPLAGSGERVALDPAADLYGGILFQRGRFRRVGGYRHLLATECLAEILPDGHAAWFHRYLPADLRLGDPGARDAAIHSIQASIPHATLLPTGIERIVTGFVSPDVPLLLAARERRRDGDLFLYDLEILAVDGTLIERWEGLRLRAVDRIAPPAAWRSALLAPYAERRLQELAPDRPLRVALGSTSAHGANGNGNGHGHNGNGLAARLLGRPVPLHHRPDGKPESGSEGEPISVAHAGQLMLVVSGYGRIGCDVEPVAARGAELWRDLLGVDRFALAQLIAEERGEDPDSAATRIWAALESLKKAGIAQGAPLTLHTLPSGGGDGWLELRSGELRIGSFLGPIQELAGPAALAFLLDAP